MNDVRWWNLSVCHFLRCMISSFWWGLSAWYLPLKVVGDSSKLILAFGAGATKINMSIKYLGINCNLLQTLQESVWGLIWGTICPEIEKIIGFLGAGPLWFSVLHTLWLPGLHHKHTSPLLTMILCLRSSPLFWQQTNYRYCHKISFPWAKIAKAPETFGSATLRAMTLKRTAPVMDNPWWF